MTSAISTVGGAILIAGFGATTINPVRAYREDRYRYTYHDRQ
jgi:hypothetical protein